MAEPGGDDTPDLGVDQQDPGILSLPPDNLVLVLSYLTASQLAQAQCVCRTWRELGGSSGLWERLYRQRWKHGVAEGWEALVGSSCWWEAYCARAKVSRVRSKGATPAPRRERRAWGSLHARLGHPPAARTAPPPKRSLHARWQTLKTASLHCAQRGGCMHAPPTNLLSSRLPLQLDADTLGC